MAKVKNFSFEVNFLPENENDSNLDDVELEELILGSKPETTKRCSRWGMSKLETWLEKRDISLDPETLNKVLRKFYGKVKTGKNDMLSPISMTGVCAVINRTLLSPPYSQSLNIVADKEFKTSK